ncbi:MAG TPA: arginase family protein [Kofleriaceae bacterium]|nr:arginase family protein [Kofleriaceae bacterium]
MSLRSGTRARDPSATRPYAILEAPSILGLTPTGVDELPGALLSHGLAERIQARHAGRVETPPYDPRRDPETLVLNAHAIAAWTPRLADAVEAVIDRGEFPVVLGGDCSIVLGSTLALRRRGRCGLLFIDGHADFYQPEVDPSGQAASMDLALATGHGPKLLTEFEGRCPLVRSEDAVAFGFRDGDEQAEYGSQPLPAELRAFDLAAIRELGVEAASRAAVAHLTRDEVAGFFIHVDADCLDDDVMPAVDYRLAGGLSWDELATTLGVALASGRARGIEVAIYNPRLDPDGAAGRRLSQLLADVLGTRAPGPADSGG